MGYQCIGGNKEFIAADKDMESIRKTWKKRFKKYLAMLNAKNIRNYQIRRIAFIRIILKSKITTK